MRVEHSSIQRNDDRGCRHLYVDLAINGAATRDRRRCGARNSNAAAISCRSRPRLSDARSRERHVEWRGGAAHSAGVANRFRASRGSLCAGRAEHRAASTGQCAVARDAATAARSWQFRYRGRARRGNDPCCRPHYRSWTWGRTARRTDRRARQARANIAREKFGDGRLSFRPSPHSNSETANQTALSEKRRRLADGGWRNGKQSKKCGCFVSARLFHLRDGRLRQRQIDSGRRHSAPGTVSPFLQFERETWLISRHPRPRTNRQSDRDRSKRDWPHAALESDHLHGGVHPNSGTLRAVTGGARARL